MEEQISFQTAHEGKGTLYLVPTPIGNLDDITFRALEILKTADIVAAEDTRNTMKLCAHFEIHTPLVSYHEHNKRASGEKLIAELLSGKTVALVTDAGTPGISDPGADLAASCIGQKIPVVPLPGANAAVTGLIASGLSTDHFLFYGFLPRQKKERTQALQALTGLPYTLVFYESPRRILHTLKDLHEAFGDRKISLSKELTKRFETFFRGKITDVLSSLEEKGEVKGEVCLIVAGAEEAQKQTDDLWWRILDVSAHVDHYVKDKNMTVRDAIKQTAVDRSVPKRDVYRIYHHTDDKSG
ncbi:16S rRNA (cytidine(1402)-2'-O)-methyltransferase [Sporolactobacillus sp. THM19-2]|jgi:16S rRNA (cytidine1402-2'-O)-methyltransferase|uniref:16S rRNA (cytidine(1402)-2'-O)-methyltransferase n=1 Tax=Sporolactobacillus sp. THM19-2 TaxID=2511171 RepID=UPI001021B1C2|nr:16S rRNA (cytidine(1402)-2'-O)-methyltransferase [Sporolactobacillus sp. THM19-2]RYL89814.1 16S rRNA (cytidine(1402)-2'-O)-methyltransferase [Sporolactobacillus sp. THM19-2]